MCDYTEKSPPTISESFLMIPLLIIFDFIEIIGSNKLNYKKSITFPFEISDRVMYTLLSILKLVSIGIATIFMAYLFLFFLAKLQIGI